MEIGIVAAEHAHRPGDMEPPNPDLNPALAQRLCQIERVRELIRLHADHHHHPGVRFLDHASQAFGTDARVRFVKWVNLDLDVVAEHVPLRAVARQAKDRRERVRRNGRAEPLDHIAVVVVMRRLDENQAKTLRSARGCGRGRHQRRTIHKTSERGTLYSMGTLLRYRRMLVFMLVRSRVRNGCTGLSSRIVTGHRPVGSL
jgi:hypothetical protein